MAWQLIYTSAQRGLVPGRSGFCTVARHPQIRERLASELERLSNYDRSLSSGTSPVIRCHRIVTIGGDSYHVLSCLQAAGVDYTGRTNHIAHHLICENHELARASSPAQVLLQFPWRAHWNEPPRYLTDTELVDLSTLRGQQSHGSPWRQLTGTGAHARLLLEPRARQGCCLAYQPGREDEFLQLVDESLGRLDADGGDPAALWQVTFTSWLQPGEVVADFMWRGCWSGSPIHDRALNEGALVLDLSRPTSLPPPPPLPVRPRPAIALVRTQEVPNTEPTTPRPPIRLREREEPVRVKARSWFRSLAGRLVVSGIALIVVVGVIVVGVTIKHPGPPPNPSATFPKEQRVNASVPSEPSPQPQGGAPEATPPDTPPGPDPKSTNQLVQTETPKAPLGSLSNDGDSALQVLGRVPTYIFTYADHTTPIDVAEFFLNAKHPFSKESAITVVGKRPSTFQPGSSSVLSPWQRASNDQDWAGYTNTFHVLTLSDDQKRLTLTTNATVVIVFRNFVLMLLQDKSASTNLPRLTIEQRWLHILKAPLRVTLNTQLVDRVRQRLFSGDGRELAIRLVAQKWPSEGPQPTSIDIAARQHEYDQAIEATTTVITNLEAAIKSRRETNLHQLAEVLTTNQFETAGEKLLLQVGVNLDEHGKTNQQLSLPSFRAYVGEKQATWEVYSRFVGEILSNVCATLSIQYTAELKNQLSTPKMVSKVPRILSDEFAKKSSRKQVDENMLKRVSACWTEVFPTNELNKVARLMDADPAQTNELSRAKAKLKGVNDKLNGLPKSLDDLGEITAEVQLGNQWIPFIEFKGTP